MTRTDWLFAFAAGIAFLVATAWHLDLPGLQYDECADAAPAVNFVRNTTNTEPMQINPSVIRLFGRPFPVMVMTYIGPVKEALYIPWFFAFGVSVATVRLLPVLAIFICFPLAYYLTRFFFSASAARITVALLAFDPGLVFYLTRDVGPAALQLLFKLLALALFVRWWKTGSALSIFGAMLMLGIAVSHKVDFLWVIGGLGAASLILPKGSFSQRLHMRTVATGLVGFVLGAAPIVAFNIATGGLTFSPLFTKFLGAGSVASGPGFLVNLETRLTQTARILNGEHLSMLYTQKDLGLGFLQFVVPLMALASIVAPFLTLRGTMRPEYFRALLATWIFILVIIVASCFSPGDLNGHHMMALYPMPHVAIAVFILMMSAVLGTAQQYLAVIPAAMLVMLNLVSVSRLNATLNETGGTRSWSDAIYGLHSYLRNNDHQLVALDWGFTLNLLVLSEGQFRITRAYKEYWIHPVTAGTIAPFLNQQAVYLSHTNEFEQMRGSNAAFLSAVDSLGYIPRIDTSFAQRDGREIICLYSLTKRSH